MNKEDYKLLVNNENIDSMIFKYQFGFAVDKDTLIDVLIEERYKL